MAINQHHHLICKFFALLNVGFPIHTDVYIM
jgi:hypothetical protein